MTTPQDSLDYEVKLGKTFGRSTTQFHSIQYVFKPASVTNAGVVKRSNDKKQIELELANAGTSTASAFKGVSQPAKDVECVLIYENGEFRLERLSSVTRGLKPSKSASVVLSSLPSSTTSNMEIDPPSQLISSEPLPSSAPEQKQGSSSDSDSSSSSSSSGSESDSSSSSEGEDEKE